MNGISFDHGAVFKIKWLIYLCSQLQLLEELNMGALGDGGEDGYIIKSL